jgi:hypothetical protein
VRYHKAIGITPARVAFVAAFFGSWRLAWISDPHPVPELLGIVAFTVWAIVLRWWTVGGLLVGCLLRAMLPEAGVRGIQDLFLPIVGACGGLILDVAIWSSSGTDGDRTPPASPSV